MSCAVDLHRSCACDAVYVYLVQCIIRIVVITLYTRCFVVKEKCHSKNIMLALYVPALISGASGMLHNVHLSKTIIPNLRIFTMKDDRGLAMIGIVTSAVVVNDHN